MKKIVCILLSTLLIFSTAVIAFSAENEEKDELNFAVASDIHYVTPLPNTTDTVTAIMGEHEFNDSTGRKTAPSGFIIDEFLNQCAENDECDFVLIPGDLATYGRAFSSEHEAVAEKFRAFEKKTGKQIYVINGNHDNGSGTDTDHEKFTEIYYEFGYDEAFSTDEGTCSYAVVLNDKYLLIALDSFDEDRYLASKVDAHRLDWVRKQANYARKTGREPILMLHHNILEHDPFHAINSSSYIISTPYSISGLLADMGIKLVFSGHRHINDVTRYTSLIGNTIYDFSFSSLGDYPSEYKTFKVNSDEITYETQKISSIDSDSLAKVCKGFSDSELKLMNKDFQAYITNDCYNSVSGGVPYNFRLDSDTEFARKFSDNLVAMLDIPLYSDNGIKAQAEEYGIEIPDSEYKTIRDLFTNIELDHYSGKKHFSKDSNEFDVLIKSVSFAVRNSVITTADLKIVESTVKSLCEKYGYFSPLEQRAFEIVYEIAGGFIADTDGVDNRDGSIPGYSIKEDYQNTFIVIAKNILSKVFDYFFRFISF